MELAKDIYKEFENIVGANNISDDPVILETYVTPMAQSQHHMGPVYGVTTPPGVAVLMPGNTEEVQAIIKLCNKHRIKYKASSTFWTSR